MQPLLGKVGLLPLHNFLSQKKVAVGNIHAPEVWEQSSTGYL